MQKLPNGGVNLLKAQGQISKKRFIEMSSKSQVNNRSSRLEVFCNETVQQILAKFTKDIFLKQVAGCRRNLFVWDFDTGVFIFGFCAVFQEAF